MPILFLLQTANQQSSLAIVFVPLVLTVLIAVPLYILLLKLIKAFIDWLKRH